MPYPLGISQALSQKEEHTLTVQALTSRLKLISPSLPTSSSVLHHATVFHINFSDTQLHKNTNGTQTYSQPHYSEVTKL